MKLKYLSDIVSPTDEIVDSGALCYSPNGKKLAIGTADRHMLLFDEKFRRRDKFATKPVDPKFGKSSYAIKCAVFSPDSSKLAVGQTDHIVFVYRLGNSWDEKKVICNKFGQSSAVTALIWPGESKLVVGLLDGKVRLASAASNKCATLYRTQASVCALAQHPNRKSFVSGHEDGTIFLFAFDTRSHSRVCVHPCAPRALLLSAGGLGILAAGCDRRIVSYAEHGRQLQQFDFGGKPKDGHAAEKEFTVAALDSSGHNAVFGSFDRIRLLCWNQRRGAWDEGSVLTVNNLYSVTGLAWKPDGSTLVCANMLGAVIAFDCAMKKTMLRNRFEVTFVSPSQAIIRDLKAVDGEEVEQEQGKNDGDGQNRDLPLANGQRAASQSQCVLRSNRGAELGEIRVLGREQRYAVAYTSSTLLLADMWSGRCSEIAWQSGGNERFYVDKESVAYIVNAGEISFVEYGRDGLAGWIRTERTNPHLVSVRIYRRKRHNGRRIAGNEEEAQSESRTNVRRVCAYLLDARTIAIVEMGADGQQNGVGGGGQRQIGQWAHGSPLDWLELNEKATKLLFRDLRAALHLLHFGEGEKENLNGETVVQHLIGQCSYVQWVPRSEAVVAQSGDQLCVWYNTDTDSRSSQQGPMDSGRMVQLIVQGEVEAVARDGQRTEVIVLENNQRVAYELDSALIELGTALDELDLGRAVLFLEQQEQRGVDVQPMWRKLASVALENCNLLVAQRCFASLNDFVRVHFIQETLLRAERQFGAPMEPAQLAEHPEVSARLALAGGQWKLAERITLEQSGVEAAVDMWRRLGRWETALELAQAMHYTEIASLRSQYEQHLHETGQQAKAAELKMQQDDPWAAMDLFLAANQPGQATQLLLAHRNMLGQLTERDAEGETENLLIRLTKALAQHELYDKAGELFEALEQPERALDFYREGAQFALAIQLARVHFPQRVVQLEEQWADWLFARADYDLAVPHFLESGNTLRAAESAIRAHEWEKALEILKVLEPSPERASLQEQIARNYEVNGQLQMAERLYVEAGKPAAAVEMFNKAGRWVDAFKLASEYFGADESARLYAEKAAELEAEGKLDEAERLFIALGEPNRAIAMYKRLDRTEEMMRLMGTFHADQVQNAYKRLGEELEAKGELRAAEEQFLLAGEWAVAADMYQQAGLWEDAHRLARAHGGERAQKQIAYLWAKSLGGNAAVKLLGRHELLEEAIGLAVGKGDFEFAFELCRLGAAHRMQFVEQKYAEHLEDEGQLQKAEEHYLKAGRAREAVEMYVHAIDWVSAERVAEQHWAERLPELFVQRARAALEQHDYAHAESFLLRANRPDIILAFYRESALWPEALRIARDYLPDQLEQCQSDYEDFQLRSGAKGAQSIVAQAKEWERQSEYRKAVDCWMRVDGATQDQQMLANALARAAELTVKFLADSDEGLALLVRIGQRQMELRQLLAAGETFLLANRPVESIHALLEAHEWAKAKRIAEELAPELEQQVDDAYREFLRTHGRIGELIDVDVVSAIDMLVQQGQWDKALSTARQQNHRPLLDKYLAIFALELLAQRREEQLLAAFRKYGSSANAQLLPIYGTLVDKLVNARAVSFELLASLRDLLLDVCRHLEAEEDSNAENAQTFSCHLHHVHFCALRKALDQLVVQQPEQADVPAVRMLRLTLAIAMLRYIEPLRPDKAFFDAGTACRLWGGSEYEGMAFLFLNQCLDIGDAVDEDDPNLVDNSPFQGTDVPTSYALPRGHFLSESEQEEAKEWVLAMSVGQQHTGDGSDGGSDKRLRRDARDCYEASAVDLDGNLYPVCIISAYPLIDDDCQELGAGKLADRRAWTTFTGLTKGGAPTDELFDVQQFLANWTSDGGNK